MQVSKVIAELRKTRQSLAETIVTIERLKQGRELRRWMTATTKKTGGADPGDAGGE